MCIQMYIYRYICKYIDVYVWRNICKYVHIYLILKLEQGKSKLILYN